MFLLSYVTFKWIEFWPRFTLELGQSVNKISVVEKFTKPGVDTGDKFGLDSDHFVLHMTRCNFYSTYRNKLPSVLRLLGMKSIRPVKIE